MPLLCVNQLKGVNKTKVKCKIIIVVQKES